ncbi:MAG: glycosyltransferase family 4 protein [Patescibacteria group bacterium]
MYFPKKKLFICITKSNWGGAQKYVFDIATNAPCDQFDTTVLLGGDGDLKKELEKAGIKTILLKNSQRDINIKKEFGLFFELIKLFKKEKPDIIHLNSSKIGIVGALAGRIVGIKKIIFTAHGWAFNEERNFLLKIFIKILSVLTIILCHKTISVSETTKKQINKIFSKKITVIKNGLREIELKNKNSAQEILSKKIIQKNHEANVILSKNPVWIGTISELHTNKGLTYAIEAIAKIKNNVIFVIIGKGEKRKELEEQIIKLGVTNKVFLIGQINLASSFLRAFDIFTLSSITEALPYVLLEAGYASLPVVASNVGGIPEIIENNKTGILVSSKNLEEIKRSIEYLLKNPLKATSLGNALKEKISKDFTQKTMLEKTFNLYKKI